VATTFAALITINAATRTVIYCCNTLATTAATLVATVAATLATATNTTLNT